MKKYSYVFAIATILTGVVPAINSYASNGSRVENIVPDATITSAIKAKYIADEKVKGLDVHVKTVNGVVTLTGKVPSSDIRDRVVSIAENTNGVKQVASHLTVK